MRLGLGLGVTMVRGGGTPPPPPAPVAAFSGTPLSGDAPLTVAFTDESTGVITGYLWEKKESAGSWMDFEGTPTAQNPTEDFDAGEWDVRLTVTGPGGSDSETKLAYVTADWIPASLPSLAAWYTALAVPGANTDPVATWLDETASNRDLEQASAGSRPVLLTAIPSVSFDGTNDYLTFAGALADVVGSVLVAFVTGTTAFATRGKQALFSTANEGAADEWFEVGIDATGRVYWEWNDGGDKRTAVGSTFLEQSTAYALALTFDGTDYYASVNGVEQNPVTFKAYAAGMGWFGDVAGADNLVMAGTVTSGGLVRPFQGQVMELAIYSGDIT